MMEKSIIISGRATPRLNPNIEELTYPRKRRMSPPLSSVEGVEEIRITMHLANILIRAVCHQHIRVPLRLAGCHSYSDVGDQSLLHSIYA